jgi:hypothetical protein
VVKLGLEPCLASKALVIDAHCCEVGTHQVAGPDGALACVTQGGRQHLSFRGAENRASRVAAGPGRQAMAQDQRRGCGFTHLCGGWGAAPAAGSQGARGGRTDGQPPPSPGPHH